MSIYYNKYIKYKSKYKDLKGGNGFKIRRPTFIVYLDTFSLFDIENIKDNIDSSLNFKIIDDTTIKSTIKSSHNINDIIFYYKIISSQLDLNLIIESIELLINDIKYNIIIIFYWSIDLLSKLLRIFDPVKDLKFIRIYCIVDLDTPKESFIKYNDKFEDIININFTDEYDPIKYLEENIKYRIYEYKLTEWLINLINSLQCIIKIYKQFLSTCASNSSINLFFTDPLSKWLLYLYYNDSENFKDKLLDLNYLKTYNLNQDLQKNYTEIYNKSSIILNSNPNLKLNISVISLKDISWLNLYNIKNINLEYYNTIFNIIKNDFKLKLYSYIKLFIIEKINLIEKDFDILEPLRMHYNIIPYILDFLLRPLNIDYLYDIYNIYNNQCRQQYRGYSNDYGNKLLKDNPDRFITNLFQKSGREYNYGNFYILLYYVFPNEIRISLPRLTSRNKQLKPIFDRFYKFYENFIENENETNIIIIPPIVKQDYKFLNLNINYNKKKIYMYCNFDYNKYEIIGCLLITKDNRHQITGFKCNNNYYIYDSNYDEYIKYDWYNTNPDKYSLYIVIFIKKLFYKYLNDNYSDRLPKILQSDYTLTQPIKPSISPPIKRRPIRIIRSSEEKKSQSNHIFTPPVRLSESIQKSDKQLPLVSLLNTHKIEAQPPLSARLSKSIL